MNEIEILQDIKELIRSIRFASWCVVVLISIGVVKKGYEDFQRMMWRRRIPPESFECDHQYEISEIYDRSIDPKCLNCGVSLEDISVNPEHNRSVIIKQHEESTKE